MSLRWVRWSLVGSTVRCGTMQATWPWSCSLWQTPFSSWVSFIRLVWSSFFVFGKSLPSIGSSSPKPWLCISILGFCNGGISFLTGLKFFSWFWSFARNLVETISAHPWKIDAGTGGIWFYDSHSIIRILSTQLHRLLYLPSYIAALLFLVEMKASNTWSVNKFCCKESKTD